MQLKHYEIVTDADKLNVDKYSESDKIRIELEESVKRQKKYMRPDGSFDCFAAFVDMCKPYNKK